MATLPSSIKQQRSPVSPRSPRVQVNQALADLIQQCRVGDQLSPEPQLAQQLGVSRATLREALRSFEERGVLIRKHGVGTFVAPPPPIIEAGLEQLESLDTLARRIGLETQMGETLIEERPATSSEANCLGVPPKTQVLSVARAISTANRPVAYLIDIVPTCYLCTQDLSDAFTGSVLDLFIRCGQPPLSHSRTNIVAEAADDFIAHELRLKRGGVLLKLEAQLYARDGRVVDYSLSYFVPGYFRFHVVRRVGESNNKSLTPNSIE